MRNRVAGLRRAGIRDGGWLLVELMIALTVLTVGVLGFMFAFQSNFRASRETANRDLACLALQSTLTSLRSSPFAGLAGTYQDSHFPATGLKDSSGSAAQVQVHFDLNETTLRTEYGPVQDLDGDGALQTVNVSGSYVLLPAHLTLTYGMEFGDETQEIFVILGP